jgi:phenylalanyl-tRNA synthetase alpha chain
MLDKIKDLLEEVKKLTANTADEAEQLRIKYLSKKGIIPQLFNEFKDVPNDQKKAVGQAINELKNSAQETINSLKEQFEQSNLTSGANDLTLPGSSMPLGPRSLYFPSG